MATEDVVIRGSDGASALTFQTAWSGRCKVNSARLGSGDPAQVAAAAVELPRLASERGLTAAGNRIRPENAAGSAETPPP